MPVSWPEKVMTWGVIFVILEMFESAVACWETDAKLIDAVCQQKCMTCKMFEWPVALQFRCDDNLARGWLKTRARPLTWSFGLYSSMLRVLTVKQIRYPLSPNKHRRLNFQMGKITWEDLWSSDLQSITTSWHNHIMMLMIGEHTPPFTLPGAWQWWCRIIVDNSSHIFLVR